MTEMRSVLDPRYDAAYEERIRELEAELAETKLGLEVQIEISDNLYRLKSEAEARVVELEIALRYEAREHVKTKLGVKP